MLKENIWVRHTWDLSKFEHQLDVPENYIFSAAELNEESRIIEVVFSAYSSDPVWKTIIEDIKRRMSKRIQITIGKTDAEYLTARYENEIVAVSGIAKKHWTDQNLLTGICVAPEHQRRGIGRYLLSLSLLRLKQMALAKAQVYTEKGSLADRKIYPLFGSQREERVRYPGVED